MSKAAIMLPIIFISFFWGAVGGAKAETCIPVNDKGWKSNYNIHFECEYRISSGHGAVLVYSEGNYSLEFRGKVSRLGAFGAPSQVSWSPDGKSFYINDGQGSDVSSIVRIYTQKFEKFTLIKNVRPALYAIYKKRTRCGAIPNTWGMGWSDNGGNALIYVEPKLRAKCGDNMGSFIAIVDVANGRVLSFKRKGFRQSDRNNY